jgi:hypothetical protein
MDDAGLSNELATRKKNYSARGESAGAADFTTNHSDEGPLEAAVDDALDAADHGRVAL